MKPRPKEQVFFNLDKNASRKSVNYFFRIIGLGPEVSALEIIVYLAFALVGILAGLIGGLLGLSGGVVTVPSLVLIFNIIGFPKEYLVHTAIGTSLAAMVLNGIAGTWAHHRKKGVVWGATFMMLPGIFIGCMLGAFIAHFLPELFLQITFGLFICFLGAYVLLKKKEKKQVKVTPPDRTMFTWIGFGIGSVSSLLGIGGGVFTVPLLLSYKYPEPKAIGTSVSTGLFITFIAAIGYLWLGKGHEMIKGSIGYIYLPAFITIGLTTVIFAPIGAKLAHYWKGLLVRRIFSGTLIIIGILMIFN